MASRGRLLVIHTSTENKCVFSDAFRCSERRISSALANASVVDVNGRINPLYEPSRRVLVLDRRYNCFTSLHMQTAVPRALMNAVCCGHGRLSELAGLCGQK